MKLFKDLPTRTALHAVAFTPKGGCPLKQKTLWQPIRALQSLVAFTPKGGCPLKPHNKRHLQLRKIQVAFTPKGGCQLKLLRERIAVFGVGVL